MLEKLIDVYTRLGKGVYDIDYRNKTKAIIKYLIDNELNESDIIDMFGKIKIEDYLKPDDLPEYLWEGSLLKKNVFYYHNSLQLIPPPPKWNAETLQSSSEDFYLEMKIQYNIDNLLEYYYKAMKIESMDYNKDKGAMQYLLNKYKIEGMENVDIVLLLIDEAHANEYVINSPLKLQDLEMEVISLAKHMVANSKSKRSNEIIWRAYNE